MSKATDKTAKNLREVHENVKVILAWAWDDDRDGFDLNKLCDALVTCVSKLENHAKPKKGRPKAMGMWDELEDRKNDAADTLAYIREIVEK